MIKTKNMLLAVAASVVFISFALGQFEEEFDFCHTNFFEFDFVQWSVLV